MPEKSEPRKERDDPEAELLVGSLKGYGITAVICTVAIVVLSFWFGRTSATGSFDLLCGVGAFGAITGYSVIGRRHRKRGLPKVEMWEFVAGGMGLLVTFAVLGGSVVMSLGLKLLLDRLMAH